MRSARCFLLATWVCACAAAASCTAETGPQTPAAAPTAPTAPIAPSASATPSASTNASSTAGTTASASASAVATPGPAKSSAPPATPTPGAPAKIAPEALVVTPFAPGPKALRGTVSRAKPFAAHGATLTLLRVSHKEYASGGVVGIWEWELRKGGAVATGVMTSERLYAETAAGGVLAVLSGEGETLDVTLVPWTQPPWTEDEAVAFADAEHARRGLPSSTSTGTQIDTGVLDRTYMGNPSVHLRVGLLTRSLLSIEVVPLAARKPRG